MKPSPAISIVVPVYNRAVIVERTLASIFSQEEIERAEVILVDNNSQDNTPGVLKRRAEEARQRGIDVTVVSEPVPGAANARNRGLSLAKAPMVMFFDSDDVLNVGALKAILSTIDAHPEAQHVIWNVQSEIPGQGWKCTSHGEKHLLWQHLVHGICSTQRMAVSRDLLNRIGGWNGNLSQWDDLEIGTRILLQNPHTVSVPTNDALATVFFTPVSITGCNYSRTAGSWEQALDAIERDLSDAFRPTHWVDVRRAILAAEYAREGNRVHAAAVRRSTLGRLNFHHRLVWRLLYLKHRLYNRGTGRLATLFYSKNI